MWFVWHCLEGATAASDVSATSLTSEKMSRRVAFLSDSRRAEASSGASMLPSRKDAVWGARRCFPPLEPAAPASSGSSEHKHVTQALRFVVSHLQSGDDRGPSLQGTGRMDARAQRQPLTGPGTRHFVPEYSVHVISATACG